MGHLSFSDHWYDKNTACERTRLMEISEDDLTITFVF